MPIVKGKPDAHGEWYDANSISRPPPPTEKIEYIEPTPAFYSVGIDWGSVNDSTAISILEVWKGWEIINGYPYGSQIPFQIKKSPDLHFLVRMVHRPRLAISYPVMLQQVASIMDELPHLPSKPLIAMDGTGLGAPVVQQARKQGLRAISIAITSGQVANVSGMDWSVPKGLLVGELRLAMHRQRLKIAQGFQEREQLLTELQAFTAKLSASGRATFAAAGTEHDDEVLSLSLALFAATQRSGESIRVQPLPY